MERLTQQEEEVMLYFWKLGPSFIRDVLNQMPAPKASLYQCGFGST